MLQFQVADLINFFLLIATIITVSLTYRQIRENSKAQKASFFKDLYSVMLSDADCKDAFFMIEYGRFIYNDRYHKSSYEKSIDRMLHYFNLVCDLYNQKILTEREMEFFKYFLLRVYQDADIQKYINFFHIFNSTLGIHPPYQTYLNYCKKEIQSQQKKSQGQNRYLTVDQASVFYEEQKSRLDELLALAKQQLTQGKDEESPFQCQLRALDLLIDQLHNIFTQQQKPNSENVLSTAIKKSGVNDLPRIIIGLKALRARFLIDANPSQSVFVRYSCLLYFPCLLYSVLSSYE